MSDVTAKYVLQLLQTKKANIYTLNRISKEGNSPALNKLLSWDGSIKFTKLEPQGLINDYMLFPIQWGAKQDRQLLLLETAMFMYPNGIVNIAGSNDCILFHMSEGLTITFFVIEGGANNTTQLLQMLVAGMLN